ncbi:MAG: hypothetical protein IGR76_13485 [Synechococcales cyanobacterium T60_A2020_003]|nr:hypothetical protein [Synechococcales cyanobacterium T60_A2020_003]
MQPIYPLRSYIRFSAKSQLLAEQLGTAVAQHFTSTSDVDPFGTPPTSVSEPSDYSQNSLPRFDDELFSVVAATVLHPCRHPEVYEPCASAAEASAIEDRVSAEIVAAYQNVQSPFKAEIVERLNQLL